MYLKKSQLSVSNPAWNIFLSEDKLCSCLTRKNSRVLWLTALFVHLYDQRLLRTCPLMHILKCYFQQLTSYTFLTLCWKVKRASFFSSPAHQHTHKAWPIITFISSRSFAVLCVADTMWIVHDERKKSGQRDTHSLDGEKWQNIHKSRPLHNQTILCREPI